LLGFTIIVVLLAEALKTNGFCLGEGEEKSWKRGGRGLKNGRTPETPIRDSVKAYGWSDGVME
jgi:hypothetical protein